MAPNGSKWLLEALKSIRGWYKFGQIWLNLVKLVEIAYNSSKLLKMVLIGSKWFEMAPRGSKFIMGWYKSGQIGSHWTK